MIKTVKVDKNPVKIDMELPIWRMSDADTDESGMSIVNTAEPTHIVNKVAAFGPKAPRDRRVNGIYFEIEKIWSSSSQNNIESEYVFKEEAKKEGCMVLTKQLVIPFESENVTFSNKTETTTENAFSLRFTASGLPDRNALLIPLGLKVNGKDYEGVKLKEKEIWLKVDELTSNSGNCSEEFIGNLVPLFRVLSRMKIPEVTVSVLELSLNGVPFAEFYKKVEELSQVTGVKVKFQERQLVWFENPITKYDLIFALSSLKGTSTSQLSESILDFCKIEDKVHEDCGDRPVGHVVRYSIPPDGEEVQTSLMSIVYDDFITTAVNPVICMTADFRPQGSLAKAFLREYRSEERLFNQKKRSGQVATLTLNWKEPSSFVFFCIMRGTCRNELFPELFLKCLWNLKNHALKLDLKVLSFPLLDWERSVIPFFQFCNILNEVFSDTDIALALYPNYFLSIR